MIEAGADPNGKYHKGDAPLHAVIRSGRGMVAVGKALLSGGADPYARDAKRYTPYHIAPEGSAIHCALDRARGHDLACNMRDAEVAGSGAGEARVMQARTWTSVRSGPGTDYEKIGLLETGEASDWFRIEVPQGGEAFVHGSLLIATAVTGDNPERARV